MCEACVTDVLHKCYTCDIFPSVPLFQYKSNNHYQLNTTLWNISESKKRVNRF